MRALLALMIALAVPSIVHAQDPAPSTESTSEEDAPVGVFARVIVDRTVMRSGPGAAFRGVRSARRGDVFPIVERGTRGYWFRVELPDATHAWISGDAVYTHELSAEEASQGRFLPEVFAPAPLLQATGELHFGFGVLGVNDPNGFMTIRPTIYIAPEIGIEATLAAAVGEGGRLMIGTLGGLVNVFPDSPVVPFLAAGGGFVVSDPNADSFLLQSGVTGALYAGGGLRIAFRYRITLRLEARAWAIYEENRYVAQEELSAGFTVFF
ncbi:SH3 domain-containing protein [Sandaracinus amylolyticus]|uniref:SH3 domain-containing protein n=1 Tax=Sandaracinus amylolyticus TaxID=927083 RepID=UPI001F3F2AF4|nr:SH3 domain-containing protein [Sandaracinus amylolyticus]UJR80689.1 Hypothetical protein I5071_27380 [Sandaracinus amylolyticus]